MRAVQFAPAVHEAITDMTKVDARRIGLTGDDHHAEADGKGPGRVAGERTLGTVGILELSNGVAAFESVESRGFAS